MTRALVLALALVLGAPAAAHAAYADVISATDGLVGHWTLDGAAAPLAGIPAGDLRVSNSGSYATQQPAGIEVGGGSSLTLSGGAFITSGSSATSPGRTVEAWIAPSTITGSRYVFSRGSGTSGYHLYLSAGKPVFHAGGRSVVGSTPLVANQWHHVVGTLDGTTLSVYIDGRLDATNTLAAPQSTSTQNLYVGRASTTSSSSYRYRGGIDEAAVYGRGLTAEEVAAHFAAGLDPTPLTVGFASGPPVISDQPDGRIAFAASRGGVTFSCTLDDLPAVPCNGTYDYELLRDGSHALRVDATRRGATVSATYAWRVVLSANESAPPVTTIAAAPPALTNSTVAAFALTGSKSRLAYACRLDGGAWAACSDAPSYAGLREGGHVLEVRATDRWGVLEEAVRSHAWRVDLTPPDTFALAAKARRGDPGSVVLGSESGARFECRSGHGDWSACDPSFPLPVVAVPTEIALRAIDRAGNADPVPANLLIAPAPAGAPIAFSGASAGFLISGVADISALRCSLDGAAAGPCPWPIAFQGLAYGRHSLVVTDPTMPGVVFPTLEWTDPLPAPKVVGSQFPAVLQLGSRRKQASLATSRLPRLLFQSNTAGSARVQLRRGNRVLRRWTAPVVQGSNLVRLPRAAWRRLRPGRYALGVVVTNAGGATETLRLRFDAVRSTRR